MKGKHTHCHNVLTSFQRQRAGTELKELTDFKEFAELQFRQLNFQVDTLTSLVYQKDMEIRKKDINLADLQIELNLTKKELKVQEESLVDLVELATKLRFELEDCREQLAKVIPGN